MPCPSEGGREPHMSISNRRRDLFGSIGVTVYSSLPSGSSDSCAKYIHPLPKPSVSSNHGIKFQGHDPIIYIRFIGREALWVEIFFNQRTGN